MYNTNNICVSPHALVDMQICEIRAREGPGGGGYYGNSTHISLEFNSCIQFLM